jgi:FkbM family methyltransferase
MTPAQFRLDTEVYGCCTTGVPGEVKAGVPLDQSMKSFLTEPCGFFIEAGAQDGVFQSNTLIFARKFGYTGLLIEPATSLIPALTQNRPESIVFNGALTSFAKNGSHVTVPSGSPMGIVSHNTTHAEATVIARSLSSLLDEHGIKNVDFLSLDVEGHEADILDGIDFRRHRPRFVLIEIWNKNPETFQAMHRACYTLYSEHVDHEGSISMWQHATAHRDFLFVDRHSGDCHTAPVHTNTTPVER